MCDTERLRIESEREHTRMKILKYIRNLLNKDSNKAAMDFAIAHGLQVGKNFEYHDGYPIDGNFPWLISIGDNVTLSTDVKILAHDASTVKVGAHTKIGRVQIGNNVFIGFRSVVLCNTRLDSYVPLRNTVQNIAITCMKSPTLRNIGGMNGRIRRRRNEEKWQKSSNKPSAMFRGWIDL